MKHVDCNGDPIVYGRVYEYLELRCPCCKHDIVKTLTFKRGDLTETSNTRIYRPHKFGKK